MYLQASSTFLAKFKGEISIVCRPDRRNEVGHHRRSNSQSHVIRFIEILLAAMDSGLQLRALNLCTKRLRTTSILSGLIAALDRAKCKNSNSTDRMCCPVAHMRSEAARKPCIRLHYLGTAFEISECVRPLLDLATMAQVCRHVLFCRIHVNVTDL
jgi:hypothetical protein